MSQFNVFCLSLSVGLSLHAGVYGDVHRVKILFNKKENALIQMADATQAQLGKNSGPYTVRM